MGRKARSAARLLALAVAMMAADGGQAQAAPHADFTLSKPSRCYAGSCRVTLRYSTAQLTAPVRLEIDWGRRGPAGAFIADTTLTCARYESADTLYGGPPVFYPGVCTARSPVYTTVGPTSVRLRVSDAAGASAESAQALTVIKPVARKRRRGASRHPLCGAPQRGEKCGPGNGRRTAGGGEKVPHAGWPAITGILWMVVEGGRRAHAKAGGPDNDELLGHHGSDRLTGGAGRDVLWGDWDPRNNNTSQRDILRGGAGNDFLYPSHGRSLTYGGAGNDYVWAYYGGGLIDCGPGRDTARVRFIGNRHRLRNCEIVKHFCGHGTRPDGGCYKPGEKPARRSRR